MELIFLELNNIPKITDQLVLTLGEFDGIHLAHQKLITKTIEESKKANIKSAVLTFDPHPDFVLGKRDNSGYITPLTMKSKVFESLGIDYLLVIRFTKEVASLEYFDFEETFLKKLNIKKIIVGFDFKYGRLGLGNHCTLEKQYDVEVLEEVKYDNEKISTTLIRHHLLEGDLETVYALLGRNFLVTGKVITGNQIGRTLGIRTANLSLENSYYGIKRGVYAVYVYYQNQRYLGVCNIGNNPTFHLMMETHLEVHIIDFNDDIYDEMISIEFIKYLREEITFPTPKMLVEQITKDIERTKQLL